MRDSFVNCDTAEDTRLTLQVNGEAWNVCPEPDQLMAFSAALVRLRQQVAAGEATADDVPAATARLLRDHLLGEYRERYDACGSGKKLAIVHALWETFVGPLGQVSADPTSGPSGPIGPPGGDSIASPDSAAPSAGPSTPPSIATRRDIAGTSGNPSPPPSATSRSSSHSFETAAVQTPPNGSMSSCSSARSGGSE